MSRDQLWREINANREMDPVLPDFIRDMHGHFGTTLRTFKWRQEPRVVMCTWRPREVGRVE